MTELTRRGALRTVAVGAVAAAGVSAASSEPARAASVTSARPQAPVVALTHVTVIDATGAPPREDVTVLVRGQRIAAVGRDVAIPAGARVIDLTGRFVIPGLCDMHVHSFPDERLSPALYVALGITTVREMSGAPHFHTWRDRIERGKLLGPRWIIAGTILDGPSPMTDPSSPGLVTNAAEARRAVQRTKREGADFVKVYSNLSAQSYDAIAREARRLRIPFAGHLPDRVPIGHAAGAGQRSIEHLNAMWYSTSTRERQLRNALDEQHVEPGDYAGWLRATYELECAAVATYSEAKAAKAFAALRRERTRMVPTLTVYQVLDKPGEVVVDAERMRYVPASVAGFWAMALKDFLRNGRTPRETERWSQLFERRLELVRAVGQAGVPILAGTDAGDLPYVVPGFGLHDELANLVQAGLSPMRALRSATLEPARLLGRDHELGTVERGKLADLVILDADPLTDVTNTTRIHALLVNGRWISPEHRARLLSDAAKAAAEKTG